MTDTTADRVLALQGLQGVREAAHTAAEVLAALAEPGGLLLDCAGVTEADLSFVQVILAAHRSAGARGKRLALAAAPVASLRQALERAGFSQPDAADPACWAGPCRTGLEATP
jgi:two-component system chemotaxis sensor kinase CheA